MNETGSSRRGRAGGRREQQTLEQRVEERTRELAALLEVSRSISSTLELEPLLDAILDHLKLVADYGAAGISIIEGDTLRELRRRSRDSDTPPPRQVLLAHVSGWWEQLARGEPVIVREVAGDEPLARAFRATGEHLPRAALPNRIHAWMAVPLTLQNRVIGTISLSHEQPGYYTDRHAALATAIATQAASAIENARLFERERRTARELTSLLEVSRKLASTLELEPLLDVVLDQMQIVADYDGASIVVLEGEHLHTVRRRATARASQIPGQPEDVPVARALPWWQLVAQGQAVFVGDMHGDEPLARAYRAMPGVPWEQSRMYYVHSWMAAPLVAKDTVIGAIVIANAEPHMYTQRHADLAMAIATQAAAAIANARLFGQVEQRARELATLLDVSNTVTSTLKLGPLLDLILEQFKTVVDYRGATLGTFIEQELLIMASRATTPERSSDRGLRFSLPRSGPIWEAIASGEPVIIKDVRGTEPMALDYRAINGPLMDGPTHRDIRAWMAVPLMLGERVIGMLTASQDVPDYFTAHHADLAMAVANQAAVAMENARLYGEAQGKAALEERQRLARELHDSVSQALFGIALGAGAARRRLDIAPERVAESLDYVMTLADAALTEMRALIFELRPETLEKDGLVVALTRHAAAVEARHELRVATSLCDEPDVPFDTKDALYRIAQEAIHNAVKHASANRIDLTMQQAAGSLILEVRDDGVGFDVHDSFPGHLGLISMRERVQGLGGVVALESEPGKGTTIRATVATSP